MVHGFSSLGVNKAPHLNTLNRKDNSKHKGSTQRFHLCTIAQSELPTSTPVLDWDFIGLALVEQADSLSAVIPKLADGDVPTL